MATAPQARDFANADRRPSMWAPFSVRDFRLLFIGFTLGQAMMPLQFVTQIFWVQSHADPSISIILIGVIGTMRGTGMLSFGLFGGALADRFDRRKLLMATQGGALVLNLAIAAIMWLTPGDTPALVGFFILTFFASSMFAVDGPTRQAIVPEILGPRLTPGGIALNTAAMQLAMPISIFGVGILVSELGFAATYALSGLGHVIEIVTLGAMAYRSDFVRQGAHGFKETIRDVGAGLTYTRRHSAVFWIIILLVVMMALAFPPTANLGPTWVTTVVGVSFAKFGFIALGWGGGAFIASTLLTRFAAIDRKGLLVAGGALLFVFSFLIFSIGTTWPFAVVGNIGLGMGMATTQVSSTALIAAMTPNHVRGRVMSLLMLNMGVAQAVTLPIAVLGQAVSLQTMFPILAFIAIGLVGAIIIFRPSIWRARVSTALVQQAQDEPEATAGATPSSAPTPPLTAAASPLQATSRLHPVLLAAARDAPNKAAPKSTRTLRPPHPAPGGD
ncbi:MAG TPA: MFS transporter [Dehalococcoidia bacterium]|nr:MFS transporter [Dehalococcoidia bacterium]